MTLLNEKQASLIVKLTPDTLKQRRSLKKPPRYYKIGSKVFYQESDLEAFIAQGAVEPELVMDKNKGGYNATYH